MKQLTIIGNIGSDAICRTCNDGTQISTFNVAVSTTNGAEWFGVTFRYLEKFHPFLVKGQPVWVQGFPKFSVYNGKPDIHISADKIELVGSARRDAENPDGRAAAGDALAANLPAPAPVQTSIPVPPSVYAPLTDGHYQ